MEMNFTLFEIVMAFAVIITIVCSIALYINVNKKKQGGNTITGDHNTQATGDGNTVNNIVNNYNGVTQASNKKSKDISVDDIKANIRILFVDDKKDFMIINMLQDNGYTVDYLEDIKDIDEKVVKLAHIIFLDINGVGVAMGFKNQGMGLCGALKDRYKREKRVILYSGETTGDIFDSDAKKADATLQKDSDLYQFTSYITQYGKELLKKTI